MATIKEIAEKLRQQKENLKIDRENRIKSCEDLLQSINAYDILEEFNVSLLRSEGYHVHSVSDINLSSDVDLCHFVPTVIKALIWHIKSEDLKSNPNGQTVSVKLGILQLATILEEERKKPEQIFATMHHTSLVLRQDLGNVKFLADLYASEGARLPAAFSLNKTGQIIRAGQRDTREKINYFLAHSFVEIFG